MPTQEERIAALEQKVTILAQNLNTAQNDFFTQFSASNRSITTVNRLVSEQQLNIMDLHHNTTILLGVMGSQGNDIKTIKEDIATLKTSVSSIDIRLTSTDQRIARLEGDISTVKTGVVRLEGDISSIKTNAEEQSKKLDQILSLLSQSPQAE